MEWNVGYGKCHGPGADQRGGPRGGMDWFSDRGPRWPAASCSYDWRPAGGTSCRLPKRRYGEDWANPAQGAKSVNATSGCICPPRSQYGSIGTTGSGPVKPDRKVAAGDLWSKMPCNRVARCLRFPTGPAGCTRPCFAPPNGMKPAEAGYHPAASGQLAPQRPRFRRMVLLQYHP